MSFRRISSLALVLNYSAWLAGCSGSALPTERENVSEAAQAVVSDPPPIVLQPDAASGKDALINDYGPTSNIGNHVVLSAGAWTIQGAPIIQRGLLSFDLSSIPAGSVVRSAKLSLHADTVTPLYGQGINNLLPLGHSDLSGSNEVLLRRVTSKWDEQAVTWNTQPTTTDLNQVVLAASTSPSQDYLDQDVTALVQDMVDHPAESDGFLLELQTEAYYRELSFVSSDGASADLRPKLEVQLAGIDTDGDDVADHADDCPNTTTLPVDAKGCSLSDGGLIVLQPQAGSGKDAHITDYAPTSSDGNNAVLSAGAWTIQGAPMVRRGLLSFDLSSIPAGSVVRSAKLGLYAETKTALYGQGIFNGLPLGHSDLSGSNEVLLRRITSKWDEQTVTWNTQPTTTDLNQVVLAASTSPSQDYLDQDVTALVQDMIDHPSESDGFLLELQTEAYYRELSFASSDGTEAELHPRLEIQVDRDPDGDGVLDPNDACPDTTSFPVDATGCSIADLVPCQGGYGSHGGYVAAIVAASLDFLQQGLITDAERGQLIKAAGKSSCGN